MDFVWVKNRLEKNQSLVFSLDVKAPCDRLEICAVDAYVVYIDGEFCSYGPNFTASGYSRKKIISLHGAAKIEIKVISYGVGNYVCDKQAPFFGAEAFLGDKTVYQSADFTCRKESSRLQSVPRYSRQRGFIEAHDFRKCEGETLSLYPVEAPVILEGLEEFCDYHKVAFSRYDEGVFQGFAEIKTPWWARSVYEAMFCDKIAEWKIKEDFLDKLALGYFAEDYKLSRLRAGFIGVEVETEQEEEVFLFFDEILPDGKWIFCRGNSYNVLSLIFPKGKHRFISAEPYALTYVKVLQKGNAKITPFFIEYENDGHALGIRYPEGELFARISYHRSLAFDTVF